MQKTQNPNLKVTKTTIVENVTFLRGFGLKIVSICWGWLGLFWFQVMFYFKVEKIKGKK